jgi:hypothetical protein
VKKIVILNILGVSRNDMWESMSTTKQIKELKEAQRVKSLDRVWRPGFILASLRAP